MTVSKLTSGLERLEAAAVKWRTGERELQSPSVLSALARSLAPASLAGEREHFSLSWVEE